MLVATGAEDEVDNVSETDRRDKEDDDDDTEPVERRPAAVGADVRCVSLCGRSTLTEKRPVMMLQKRTVTPIRYSLIKLMSVSRLAYWSEKRRIERYAG